jgi:hypothetical protein
MPRTDLTRIYERVNGVSERDDVEEFAIGTTVDVALARAALRAEDIVSVYEASTLDDSSVLSVFVAIWWRVPSDN